MNERRGDVLRIPCDEAIIRVYDHPPDPIRGVPATTEEVPITAGGVKFSVWVRVIEEPRIEKLYRLDDCDKI
jgi:hypothetical protein